MRAVRVPLILSVLRLRTVNGCFSLFEPEPKPEALKVGGREDYLEIDQEKNFFTLENRAANSCLEVNWYRDIAMPKLQNFHRCNGEFNQQFELRDGRLEYSCLCLGASKLRDGRRIRLVPLGHEDELNWNLDENGNLYVTNTYVADCKLWQQCHFEE